MLNNYAGVINFVSYYYVMFYMYLVHLLKLLVSINTTEISKAPKCKCLILPDALGWDKDTILRYIKLRQFARTCERESRI